MKPTIRRSLKPIRLRLCYRCEWRALHLDGLASPRSECTLTDIAVEFCEHYRTVEPLLLYERQQSPIMFGNLTESVRRQRGRTPKFEGRKYGSFKEVEFVAYGGRMKYLVPVPETGGQHEAHR